MAKVRFVYKAFKSVTVECDYIPVVGDYVSLLGIDGVPSDIAVSSLVVTSRSYHPFSGCITVILEKVEIKL